MRFCRYIITGAALALLTACNGKLPVTPAGEANGAIVLKAGISEGQSGVQTKAYDPEANHDESHLKFTVGTALTLRVDGVWKGKEDNYELPLGKVTSQVASQETTATIGAVVDGTDEKHNDVKFKPSEKLYWDDYGSADPANMSTAKGGTVSDGTDGRGRGLDIFAVAVDGVTTAPKVSSWTALPWSVGEVSDGAINQTSGWGAQDLLTSNNVKKTNDVETTNPYKFDERDAGKLLVFTHSMTKVTVNLTAGEGFVGGKFVNKPSVTLLGFNYTGTYNVETKTPAATATTNINAWINEGAAWESAATAQGTAIVFPGNQFLNDTDILRIEADGNIYYVNATQINVVNTEQDNTFEQAKNYIFNITINKTEINVTATITEWDDVESAEVSPEINVNAGQGISGSTVGSGFDGFSFYRSSIAHDAGTMNTGYSAGIDPVNGFTPAEAVATKPGDPALKWPFQTIGVSPVATKLFWPTHDTHYQFRGVWPLTVTTEIPAETKPTDPHVETVDSKQVINIYNTAYTSGSYPSDLLIGRPEFDHPDSEICSNSDHTARNLYTYGICATTGLVNLNFRYMMSQVEVVLSTTDNEAVDHVNLGTNTIVEIVNGYTDGYVGLGDMVVFTYGDKGSYPLDNVEGVGNDLKRHSAIVPQPLTYTTAGAETNLRFKITVTNSDSTTDIYYADINPIKKSGSSDLVAPNGKWERGVHYKYNLKIKKTEISVTATITDWKVVEGEEDVWF